MKPSDFGRPGELHVGHAVRRVEDEGLVAGHGRVINPLLVEGQLMGGLAQGVAQALLERLVYDDEGQLLTGSLMDYALPRADDVPEVPLGGIETRSPANALGAKGVGESGAIGVPAAIVNAAVEALRGYGLRHVDVPLTPEKLWRALQTQTPGEKQR